MSLSCTAGTDSEAARLKLRTASLRLIGCDVDGAPSRNERDSGNLVVEQRQLVAGHPH